MCLFCKGTITLPVRLKHENLANNDCHCDWKFYCCLHCVRDMIGKSSVSFGSTFTACFYCGRRFRLPIDKMTPASLIYEKDLAFAQTLDQKFGQMTCPRCETWVGNRLDFNYVHINQCPNMAHTCPYCRVIVVPASHDCPQKPRYCSECHLWISGLTQQKFEEQSHHHVCKGCGKMCDLSYGVEMNCSESMSYTHRFNCRFYLKYAIEKLSEKMCYETSEVLRENLIDLIDQLLKRIK